MVRETSVRVYNEIQLNGLLPYRRMQVYSILFHHGPLTASQIGQQMPNRHRWGGNVHARLVELREMGVVKELKEVQCPVTRNKVIQFDVTSKLPKKYSRGKTKLCECQESLEKAKEVLNRLLDYPLTPQVRGIIDNCLEGLGDER